MTFQASPPHAKLYLDDEALPANPTTKLMPVDGKTHVFSARAEGHVEASSEFSPAQDSTLRLALEAVPRNAEPEPGPGAPPARRGNVRPSRVAAPAVNPPSPATAAPAKPNCDSPFFLDKDGIRRMRPECIH
jgi:hypothetical protein